MSNRVDERSFDIHCSVRSRAIVRLIIKPMVAIGFVILGVNLLPENLNWQMAPADFRDWDFWSIIGIFSLISGGYMLIQEAIFALRSFNQSGEWHFRLSDDELLWDVPVHSHGEEQGFRVKLSEIKEIEYRTIIKYDEMDAREYWVHFVNRDSVELKSYSGLSIDALVEKIEKAGVRYKEKTVGG
ncbi:MAG: hypothetical protein ABJN65_08025 [Parasphingorhabdus sp.]